jgi:predicted nucleic acid-binding protein
MPSMPTEALLDVNVVIASVFADHINHLPARRFVESLERFYTTPTVQGGFLRFATRRLKDESANQFRVGEAFGVCNLSDRLSFRGLQIQ